MKNKVLVLCFAIVFKYLFIQLTQYVLTTVGEWLPLAKAVRSTLEKIWFVYSELQNLVQVSTQANRLLLLLYVLECGKAPTMFPHICTSTPISVSKSALYTTSNAFLSDAETKRISVLTFSANGVKSHYVHSSQCRFYF